MFVFFQGVPSPARTPTTSAPPDSFSALPLDRGYGTLRARGNGSPFFPTCSIIWGLVYFVMEYGVQNGGGMVVLYEESNIVKAALDV